MCCVTSYPVAAKGYRCATSMTAQHLSQPLLLEHWIIAIDRVIFYILNGLVFCPSPST